jgi:hypothetical protein
LIKRRVEQFNAKWHYLAPTAVEDCLTLLHEMFDFASTRPDIGTKVVEFAKSMLRDRVPHYKYVFFFFFSALSLVLLCLPSF